jgi:hypothetical protein
MFERIHQKLGTAGFIISIVALVAALSGGAYAATNSGGGKATASAKAKQGPRGKTGKTGPAGPAGPVGPVGPAGPKGDAGAAGSNGTPGTPGAAGKSVTVTAAGGSECEGHGGAIVKQEGAASGTEVCNGEPGEEGSPWTDGGTLPSEATETGVWQFISAGKAEEFLPISFPIPLTATAAGEITIQSVPNGHQPTADCPGTSEEPQAEPGFLCIYGSSFQTAGFLGTPNTGYKPVSSGGEEEGVIGSGTLLYFEETTAGSHGTGSFAVTAP